MSEITGLLAGIAALLATALAGIALGRRAAGRLLVYGTALLLCSAMAALALTHLLDPAAAPSTAWLPLGLPWQGALFRLDALSAFFAFVIGLGGAAASLFALGYGRHEPAPGRVLPFYPLFLAGMNLVVLADDAFSFLLSWEFMSLSSWALVMAHHQEHDNARAGYVYLVMASLGTLALLLCFGLLASSGGDYTFDAMRAAAHGPATTLPVLVLALLGAGSKAGIVPLHAWLPLAHPAAPSHVSALMSGVMTKVAVYGFIRIAFELSGEAQWWSGFLVLLAGGATAVLGVLYALMQHDLKRLLAYHTVENIGIIYIGLGLALAFQSNGLPAAAALALTAALFHVLNHSLFKSLLFFGAGAVLSSTGERDMERLGGLIHRMPRTAFAFLAGCIAISALPPLNGFVSEWLTFQAILQSPELPQWALKIMVPAVGGLLALSAALAAACFVKAFGISFLGRPRSDAAREAQETDGFSLAAMFALTALCLAAGILPGFVIDALAPAMQALLGERMPLQAGVDWLSIVPVAAGRSSYNGWLVFTFIALSASLAVVIIHRFASHARRRAPAWDCGAPEPDPATQYTAGSFAQPIRRVFGTWVFAAREQVELPPPGSTAPARHVAVVRDLLWEWLYAPVAGAIAFASERLNVLQFLTIRRYLTLVFLALVTLLLVLAIWP
ncbi:MAG TPA: hydrogenase 4 subunit B [Steroidobacteraceae bacterium]|nr:hydrogenase 4 subunit B [Steroidobacteraceae bacterium]